MDNSSFLIGDILGQRSRLDVLRCLQACNQDLTGREIARRAGLSHQRAHQVLKALVSLGVAERRLAAPAHLFRLNREHWLVKDILRIIFEKETGWLDELLSRITEGLPVSVVSLILFGSAANGELRGGSDIDLLALTKRGEDKEKVVEHFGDLSAAIHSRYRLPLAPVVMTAAEFKERFSRAESFARGILRNGRVLKGRLLTEVL